MTDRRADITNAARELIRDDPRTTPSVRELAAKVHLSPGAIYGHYRDLDDVLLSVRRSVGEDLLAALEASVAGFGHESPLERAMRCHEAIVDTFLKDTTLFAWIARSGHPGPSGIEPRIADFLGVQFDLDRATGMRLVESSFQSLSPLSELVLQGSMNRGALVMYVHRTQMALVDLLAAGR